MIQKYALNNWQVANSLNLWQRWLNSSKFCLGWWRFEPKKQCIKWRSQSPYGEGKWELGKTVLTVLCKNWYTSTSCQGWKLRGCKPDSIRQRVFNAAFTTLLWPLAIIIRNDQSIRAADVRRTCEQNWKSCIWRSLGECYDELPTLCHVVARAELFWVTQPLHDIVAQSCTNDTVLYNPMAQCCDELLTQGALFD